jgi:hypothetical protein
VVPAQRGPNGAQPARPAQPAPPGRPSDPAAATVPVVSRGGPTLPPGAQVSLHPETLMEGASTCLDELRVFARRGAGLFGKPPDLQFSTPAAQAACEEIYDGLNARIDNLSADTTTTAANLQETAAAYMSTDAAHAGRFAAIHTDLAARPPLPPTGPAGPHGGVHGGVLASIIADVSGTPRPDHTTPRRGAAPTSIGALLTDLTKFARPVRTDAPAPGCPPVLDGYHVPTGLIGHALCGDPYPPTTTPAPTDPPGNPPSGAAGGDSTERGH